MMERQLGHMVRLIDDLMDIARITSGKLRLRKERVELAAVVQSAVEETRLSSKHSRINSALQCRLSRSPRRRSNSARPSLLQSAQQCRQIYREGRAHLADCRTAGRRGFGVGSRHGDRDRREKSAAAFLTCFRKRLRLRSGRKEASEWSGFGTGTGRVTWRQYRRPKQRSRAGKRIHRPVAGYSSATRSRPRNR